MIVDEAYTLIYECFNVGLEDAHKVQITDTLGPKVDIPSLTVELPLVPAFVTITICLCINFLTDIRCSGQSMQHNVTILPKETGVWQEMGLPATIEYADAKARQVFNGESSIPAAQPIMISKPEGTIVTGLTEHPVRPYNPSYLQSDHFML